LRGEGPSPEELVLQLYEETTLGDRSATLNPSMARCEMSCFRERYSIRLRRLKF
jgi:hypothetical protein